MAVLDLEGGPKGLDATATAGRRTSLAPRGTLPATVNREACSVARRITLGRCWLRFAGRVYDKSLVNIIVPLGGVLARVRATGGPWVGSGARAP